LSHAISSDVNFPTEQLATSHGFDANTAMTELWSSTHDAVVGEMYLIKSKIDA